MLEQVKPVNGMIQTMGLEFNQPGFNQSLPWENIGQPIVAPNLTSMTGGVLLDTSHGPVTLEVPEVTDRYIVFQRIDGFTHNFHYIGTRADGGKAGRVTFHRPSQDVNPNVTLVTVETDHAVIVIRIDIADESELPGCERSWMASRSSTHPHRPARIPPTTPTRPPRPTSRTSSTTS